VIMAMLGRGCSWWQEVRWQDRDDGGGTKRRTQKGTLQVELTEGKSERGVAGVPGW
jgi:hypothetical protein